MKKKVVKALLFYKDSGKYYLLLLERSKQLFHGMEDLPGGKLEPDELPIPGLMREIKEETQLDVSELFPIATHEWEGPDGRQFLEYL
jgi:ADP-ribose pyrophosphatase YjhB (NUDIX family)